MLTTLRTASDAFGWIETIKPFLNLHEAPCRADGNFLSPAAAWPRQGFNRSVYSKLLGLLTA
jgi:hypothetical protein